METLVLHGTEWSASHYSHFM